MTGPRTAEQAAQIDPYLNEPIDMEDIYEMGGYELGQDSEKYRHKIIQALRHSKWRLSNDDAEDRYQDSLLSIIRQDHYSGIHQPFAWLQKAAFRAVLDWVDKEKHRQEILTDWVTGAKKTQKKETLEKVVVGWAIGAKEAQARATLEHGKRGAIPEDEGENYELTVTQKNVVIRAPKAQGDPLEQIADAEENLEEKVTLQELVRDALSTIPEPYRTTLWLRYVEPYIDKQTAKKYALNVCPLEEYVLGEGGTLSKHALKGRTLKSLEKKFGIPKATLDRHLKEALCLMKAHLIKQGIVWKGGQLTLIDQELSRTQHALTHSPNVVNQPKPRRRGRRVA